MTQKIQSMNMQVLLNIRAQCTLDPACLPSYLSPFQDAEWFTLHWKPGPRMVFCWLSIVAISSVRELRRKTTFKCKYGFFNPMSSVFKLIKITQITYSSLLFCCSDKKKNGQEQPGAFTSQSVMEGTQGRNLEAGTESGTKGECFLLACSPRLVLDLCCMVQTYLPRNGTTHNGLGSLISINNQENDPKDISTGQPDTVPSPRWL